MVGLIQLVSITVNAADITDEYTYKKYLTITSGNEKWYVILLSDNEISQRSISTSGSAAVDPNIAATVTLQGTYYVTTLNSGNLPNCCTLIYNGNNWEYRLPIYQIASANTVCALYKYLAGTVESSTKPSGFPTIDFGLTKSDVQTLINNQINATTSITTSAKDIQTQATNAYVDYSNGNITLTQLQSTIDSLASQLQNLNNNSSATLADKVAINNAQLQVQIVQDAANNDVVSGYLEEIYDNQELTSSCKSRVTTYQNRINIIYNNFTSGSITQSEAITQVRNYITDCHYYIAQATSQADIDAYNAVINAATGTLESISNYKELDPSVSDQQVQSDQEEIELLNEMISVMQDQTVENKMEDQLVAGQAGDINSILEPIWNNKYMTYLVGVSGVLILACIVLHTKYRML